MFFINQFYGFYIDIAVNQYGNLVLFYAGAFCGILFLLEISLSLSSKLLIWIGQNTISFLCLNTIMIRISSSLFYCFVATIGIENNNNSIFSAIVITVITTLLLTGVAYVIRKYFPIFCGVLPNYLKIKKSRDCL